MHPNLGFIKSNFCISIPFFGSSQIKILQYFNIISKRNNYIDKGGEAVNVEYL